MPKFDITIEDALRNQELVDSRELTWGSLASELLGRDATKQEGDTLRKHNSRLLESATSFKDVIKDTVSFTVKDGEVDTAAGTVELSDNYNLADAKAMTLAMATQFNLDPRYYELVSYTPTFVDGKFKVNGRFQRKKGFQPYEKNEIVERYERILSNLGKKLPVSIPATAETASDNLLVINLCDLHYNKMPFDGFNAEYLDKFEQMVYDNLVELLSMATQHKLDKIVLTLGHDFFQTNDSRGTTKKGTPVEHVQMYKEMFNKGVEIMANCVELVAKTKIPTEAYYVLANHDSDSAWHAVREVKLMYKDDERVNVIVDKFPVHYIEWGENLIELVHENIKSNRGFSSMPVLAKEAWGRTSYRYSIGGHLHGEYKIKEKNGIVMIGSRALSDTDEWHMLNGYVENMRGIQSYVFNKTKGNVAVFNVTL